MNEQIKDIHKWFVEKAGNMQELVIIKTHLVLAMGHHIFTYISSSGPCYNSVK